MPTFLEFHADFFSKNNRECILDNEVSFRLVLRGPERFRLVWRSSEMFGEVRIGSENIREVAKSLERFRLCQQSEYNFFSVDYIAIITDV